MVAKSIEFNSYWKNRECACVHLLKLSSNVLYVYSSNGKEKKKEKKTIEQNSVAEEKKNPMQTIKC